MNIRSMVSKLVVLAVVWSCAGGSAGGAREPGPARSSDLVTAADLSLVPVGSNLYDVLHSLRPLWFQKLPTTMRESGDGDVVVYLDQSRLGGPESLRTIIVASVGAVRHYTPTEAQARFGLGHQHGAIEVITIR